MYVLGFDIGGTKCAVITANTDGEKIKILRKEKCDTNLSVSAYEMIEKLIGLADKILDRKPDAIGISSGGPLDSERGIIMSPPNLPGWDNIEIVRVIEEHYKVKPKLHNDANASAVAEWKFGAGRGCDNMVFMTFGTGLGAGLILDGKLYIGKNGNAGEIGHIRLADDGPIGYGKRGSFEGFCSGGGIAKLGLALAKKASKLGTPPSYYKEGMEDSDVSAKTIAEAALSGDETALEVYRISGEHLGKGLAVLIDILNPECIVIGSVFARSRNLLWEKAEEMIKKEALPEASSVCKVVAAELGEKIGDYAAISAALI